MVLSDGTVFDSHTLDSGDYDSIIKQGGIVSNIASTVKKIVTEKRELIKEVFPKLDRFMTGYNLFHALEDSGNINLNYIVSGSEGTLALFTEVKVKIMKKPQFEQVVVCKFLNFRAWTKVCYPHGKTSTNGDRNDRWKYCKPSEKR